MLLLGIRFAKSARLDDNDSHLQQGSSVTIWHKIRAWHTCKVSRIMLLLGIRLAKAALANENHSHLRLSQLDTICYTLLQYSACLLPALCYNGCMFRRYRNITRQRQAGPGPEKGSTGEPWEFIIICLYKVYSDKFTLGKLIMETMIIMDCNGRKFNAAGKRILAVRLLVY